MREFNEHEALSYKIEWPKCDLHDFSKLHIEGGRIHYRVYQQDGSMQDMDCADTHDNRLNVSWIQIHDRYGERDRPKVGEE